MPITERCKSYVTQDGPTVRPEFGACWLRTERAYPNRYWTVQSDGKNEGAHRVAWEIASGETIPPGMFICHVCDVPGCTRNDPPGTYEVGKVTDAADHLIATVMDAAKAVEPPKEG